MKLGSEEAKVWLAAARVARLATVDESGAPHIVPVTFVVEDDQAAIGIDHKPKSTTSLKRLRNIAANPRVSLLADEYSDTWEDLWWARADGDAVVVEQGDPAWGHWWDRLAERYAQYRENQPRGPVIVISVDWWTGWAYQGNQSGARNADTTSRTLGYPS